MMRRVLIVSPHFPPINAPDMQRIRMSLPHYRACGWEPVVLCVGERWQDAVREPGLDATVPADVAVVRRPAFALRWTRLLGVRNLGLRCWCHFLAAGSRIIRRERIDLVFFSNTQFVTFTLGRIWGALHGVPYVVDIQDPWRTDYYSRAGSRKPPGGWKYKVARAMAWLLEGWSFRRVDGVMSVSPAYLDDLRARYSWLTRTPADAIPFGASREDLAAAIRVSDRPPYFSRTQGEIHLLYTGAAGPVMPHALTVLFDALRLYREKNPTGARRFRFHFVGTSYAAPGQGVPAILPLAERCGVADQVAETPHRLGHLESLRLQQEADVLLLAGSSDLAYSPSKIYPCFLAGPPILAVVFSGSVLENILDELQCAFLVRFREAGPRDAAQAALTAFFDTALAGFPAASLPERNRAFFERHYLAPSLTQRQAGLFDAALARHRGQPAVPTR